MMAAFSMSGRLVRSRCMTTSSVQVDGMLLPVHGILCVSETQKWSSSSAIICHCRSVLSFPDEESRPSHARLSWYMTRCTWCTRMDPRLVDVHVGAPCWHNGDIVVVNGELEMLHRQHCSTRRSLLHWWREFLMIVVTAYADSNVSYTPLRISAIHFCSSGVFRSSLSAQPISFCLTAGY